MKCQLYRVFISQREITLPRSHNTQDCVRLAVCTESVFACAHVCGGELQWEKNRWEGEEPLGALVHRWPGFCRCPAGISKHTLFYSFQSRSVNHTLFHSASQCVLPHIFPSVSQRGGTQHPKRTTLLSGCHKYLLFSISVHTHKCKKSADVCTGSWQCARLLAFRMQMLHWGTQSHS